MKKIIIFVLLFFITSLKVFANDWVLIAPKIYVKIDKVETNQILYWIKRLNDGTIKPIKNKKVFYSMGYQVSDCSDNTAGVLAYYVYGVDGDVLNSFVSPYVRAFRANVLEPVIPQSIMEVAHNYACSCMYQH